MFDCCTSGNWVERYDPVTDSWTEEPGFNQTRLYHAAALAGGYRIFVIGGQAQDSCDGVPEVLASAEAIAQPSKYRQRYIATVTSFVDHPIIPFAAIPSRGGGFFSE